MSKVQTLSFNCLLPQSYSTPSLTPHTSIDSLESVISCPSMTNAGIQALPWLSQKSSLLVSTSPILPFLIHSGHLQSKGPNIPSGQRLPPPSEASSPWPTPWGMLQSIFSLLLSHQLGSLTFPPLTLQSHDTALCLSHNRLWRFAHLVSSGWTLLILFPCHQARSGH